MTRKAPLPGMTPQTKTMKTWKKLTREKNAKLTQVTNIHHYTDMTTHQKKNGVDTKERDKTSTIPRR